MMSVVMFRVAVSSVSSQQHNKSSQSLSLPLSLAELLLVRLDVCVIGWYDVSVGG